MEENTALPYGELPRVGSPEITPFTEMKLGRTPRQRPRSLAEHLMALPRIDAGSCVARLRQRSLHATQGATDELLGRPARAIAIAALAERGSRLAAQRMARKRYG